MAATRATAKSSSSKSDDDTRPVPDAGFCDRAGFFFAM